MWWIILITCILAVFIYLLFVPLFIEIDSVSKLFRIRFQQFISATLIFNEKPIVIELKILGWKKQFDWSNANTNKKKPVAKEERKKSKRGNIRKVINLIMSFRINKFFLTLDTGNMPLNGMLYPLFVLLSKKSKKNIIINFLDDNRLILQLENRIAWILWSYIKTIFLK